MPCPVGICTLRPPPKPFRARGRTPPPEAASRTTSGGGASAPLISLTGMDGQAPPLPDAVVLEPLAVGDELHPRRPVEVEDAPAAAPPSGMDGQVPPLYNVTRDPLTVSDELQPTGEVVDDALPVAPDIVKGEVMEDDVLPVATDIINDAASECPEAGSDGVVLTDELRNRIVKQVRSLWTSPLQLLFPYELVLLNMLTPKFLHVKCLI